MLQWQRNADAITRSYFGGNQRFDFNKMLSDMESAVRQSIQDEPDDKKHIYLAPLDDGSIIEIDFHKDHTIVNVHDNKLNKAEVLSKASSLRGETAPLRSFSTKLKKDKRGLGYPFPDMLQNTFRSIRAGELITFENGTSFLCTEKDSNIITLKKICGDITGESDVRTLLGEGKAFEVDANSDKEMQALYRIVYDHVTDSVKGRISSISTAKAAVDSMIGSAAAKTDRRIDLGPVMLRIKKGAFMSPTKVYDSDNNVLSNEQLYTLYAWMNSAPVIIDFEHDDNELGNDYDDTCFGEYIEQFFKEGKFDNVYKSICEYVYQMKGKLKISIRSYIKNDMDFYADGFVFSFEKDAVIMRRAPYGDNDITHKIVALKKSPARLFSDFCAEKYNSDFFLMKNKKRAVLRKSLPKSSYVIA